MTINNLNNIQRILIIKLSAIGDVIMATPAAKAIRQKYPNAYIAWAIEEKSLNILKGNPYVDEIIVVKRKWSTRKGIIEGIGVIKGILAAKRDLQSKNFDIAIDLQGLMRSALLGKISGAKIRLGFDSAGEGAPWFYTLKLEKSNRKPHGPLDYLSLLKLIDIHSDDIDMLAPYSDDDIKYVDSLIKEFTDGNELLHIAGLCPSTTWAQKHWTESGWAGLADMLSKDYGLLPVFMGSSADNKLINSIQSKMLEKSINAAGRTDLNQASAFISRCRIIAAVDTGLLHMAVGSGRPTVGIFGPTGWKHLAQKSNFRPVASECPYNAAPCLRHPVCKEFDCMKSLKAKDVIDAVRDWL